VNPDDQTVRLLDAAVPPIPDRLRTPPYERIRARSRRRRTAMICTAAATVVVLVAGIVTTAALRPNRSTVVGGLGTAAAPSDPAAGPGVAVAFLQARVSRSGNEVTVYVNPPSRCDGYVDPSLAASEDDATARITLRVSTVAVDCDSAVVTTATITLSRPLGGRTIIDGVTGETVPTFYDTNLPRVPPGWPEVHVGYTRLEGGNLDVQYTRTGGPDLIIMISRGGGLDPTPIERVQLGSHAGVIVPGLVKSYDVDWMVGDLLYQMRLEPSEGGSVTLNQTHTIIAQLTWP
jgi:hypothetical protein